MGQTRIFHAGDSPLAAVYNEAALRAHLEGLFAVGAIHGTSDQDAVEGAITKLVAHPHKLFRFGTLQVQFRPDQQNFEPTKPKDTIVVETPADAAPEYTDTEQAYIDAARKQFHKDGELELDDGAVVSLSDEGGAYVQMWKWVPDHLVDLPEADDDAQD